MAMEPEKPAAQPIVPQDPSRVVINLLGTMENNVSQDAGAEVIYIENGDLYVDLQYVEKSCTPNPMAGDVIPCGGTWKTCNRMLIARDVSQFVAYANDTNFAHESLLNTAGRVVEAFFGWVIVIPYSSTTSHQSSTILYTTTDGQEHVLRFDEAFAKQRFSETCGEWLETGNPWHQL